MYQQHLKDEKSTSLTDFLLVIVFLAARHIHAADC